MSEFDKDIKKDASEEASNRKKKLLGKILCVFFAVVLWVYVSYDKNPDTSRVYSNIPVSLAGIEVLEGRKLTVLTSDMYASVRLSGTRNTLSKVNKDDIKVIFNYFIVSYFIKFNISYLCIFFSYTCYFF